MTPPLDHGTRPDRRLRMQNGTQKSNGAEQLVSRSPDVRDLDVACYINEHWREDGRASIYVLKRAQVGGYAAAGFMVDVWCTGLKDAWGQLDVTAEEFNESIVGAVSEDVALIRIDVDLARRLVAGGIRFANENGFRLPPRYSRWTAILGDLGDASSAGLEDFGCDGRLLYLGTRKDLGQRLIGCSVEEFLSRPDVDFEFLEDDPALYAELDDAFADDELAAVEDTIDKLKESGLSAIRQWCFASGMPPHRRLDEAWDLVMESMLQVNDSPAETDFDDEQLDCATDNLDALLAFEKPADRAELITAIEQVRAFISQHDSPEDLFNALGIDAADYDDTAGYDGAVGP